MNPREIKIREQKRVEQLNISTSQTSESDINEQMLALRQHLVEAHQCSECRKLLDKLANSIHVTQFGPKLANKIWPLLKH